jgi:hypothetical protein
MKRLVKRFSDLVRKMSPESRARIAEGTQKITDAEFKSHISATWVGELVQRAQSLSHDSSPGDVASIAVRCRHLLQQLEQMNERYVCNLCGHPCSLGPERNMGGLVNQTVDGNYDSTPGNGQGALDDCTTYRFSLCEFCLDWLFQQFVVPVTVFSYQGDGEEPFRPAAVRVRDEEWREQKDRFYEEAKRRADSRTRRDG